MAREDAVTEAALFGVGGIALVSLGNLATSAVFSALDFWLALLPGLLVWIAFAYVGAKQFAKGMYVLLADVQRHADSG